MNIHLPSPLDQIFKDLSLEQIIAVVAGAFVVGGLVGGAIGAAAGGSSEGTGSSDQATAPTLSLIHI